MSQIRSALWMILALVGRFGLLLLGAVIALALVHGDGDSQDIQSLPKRAGRVFVGNDGRIIHVVPNIEQGSSERPLVIHGSDGRELVNLHVFLDGRFTLEPASNDPFGFSVHRGTSGSAKLGVNAGHGQLLLEAQTDGSAQILFKDQLGQIVKVMRVDADGRVFPE
jgi:hypothetical protein